MDTIRRPAVLAAIAAALLVLNVVFVLGRDGGDVDDPLIADGTATGEDGQDPATSGPADEETADGDAAAGGDDDGTAASEDAAADDGGDGEDGAEDQSGSAEGEDEGITVPASGTYTYASSGTWSLQSSAGTEDHTLPATATATVEADGDTWALRLAAGDDYADRLGFLLSADGGLDWTTWVLERTFDTVGRSETVYSCSGDSAYYRPDEQGRVVEHDCESADGITSDGTIEHLGSEEVTLGDGTTVTADRLLYTYTVGGGGTVSGQDFTASGEGRLDLWIDPATGLRLREVRSIASTSSFTTGDSSYAEDTEFLLESLTPA